MLSLIHVGNFFCFRKKKYSTGTESNKYDLTENSKTFTKSGERRISATPSQTSAVYPVSSSPVSVYCSSDELYSAKRAPYEKLSEASDPGMMENPLYILPKNFPPRGRASTSTSRIFFNTTSQRSSKSPSFSTSCDGRLSNNGLSTIENLSYKPPNEMKVSCSTLTQITLDSPVEGGLDIDATKHSVNSLNSESASFCDDSSFFIDRSLRGTTLNVSNSYIPMSATEQNLVYFLIKCTNVVEINATISLSPPFLDHCNDQKESFVLGDAIHHISESAQGPPEIQAPALPGAAVGYRPQRPYTLDLTSPPTPAESGISTAGSSYRSFSSVDQG
ncbi:unnamed protein product, partial [Brugia pahangi]|uniref:GAB2 n=1 Tax=Brugia pahangi TaxID=6280 RepID=A0A0N4T9Y2_BRUPA